ncbi:hypothetical protein CRYUN_Cryun02cG0104700 [Craigia yunnanensis]
MASTKVQRIMTQPIKARIEIWLFEQKDLRIEGRIIGFDEYMNLVLDDAEEVNIKKKSRKSLGRILLKGDNITLMMNSVFDCSSYPVTSVIVVGRTFGSIELDTVLNLLALPIRLAIYSSQYLLFCLVDFFTKELIALLVLAL